METLRLNAHNTHDIEQAGAILRRGGLVAIPTETVYGLAANALDGAAVRRIYEAKGRPSDNPLIVHISRFQELGPLVKAVPASARRLAEAFWPGPLTMIFEKSALIPAETSGGLDTVAVRLPAHPAARAVIEAAGVPLAAPSANLSGRPSPTTFAHVQADLSGRVDALLDGGDCPVGVESTVITLVGGTPRVLRPGGVTVEQLRQVLGEVEVDQAVAHQLAPGGKAASPGMKYKHYAPRAQVTLVDDSPENYTQYVNGRAAPGVYALCFDETAGGLAVPCLCYGPRFDGAAQARQLFTALHRLDEEGARAVFAQRPGRRGVGLAVYNRLIRAAAFRVIRPGGSLIVGLTGPSGGGKSTVAGLLRQAGCCVIDCDALTRSPQVYDSDCMKELQEAFGPLVASGGVLARQELARRAFASEEGRRRLGQITFPRIVGAIRRQMEELAAQGSAPIVLDAPTLFEAGLDTACARVLVVSAPEEERLGRVMARDGLTKDQARLRFSAQPGEAFYAARADWLIENGPGARLEEALAPVLEELKGEP